MNELLTDPSWVLTREAGPYGPWTVATTDDGRRLGVSVSPYRSRTHLLIHDVNEPTRTYWTPNLPPTSNPWLRAVAALSDTTPDYHWDTPAYRSLCEQGGLDPDYHRPVFDAENIEIGNMLVVELNKARGLSILAGSVVLDIIDHLRIDQWVSDRKSIETIQHSVRFNAEHDPKGMDELREFLSRLPALSRLRLM